MHIKKCSQQLFKLKNCLHPSFFQKFEFRSLYLKHDNANPLSATTKQSKSQGGKKVIAESSVVNKGLTLWKISLSLVACHQAIRDVPPLCGYGAHGVGGKMQGFNAHGENFLIGADFE